LHITPAWGVWSLQLVSKLFHEVSSHGQVLAQVGLPELRHVPVRQVQLELIPAGQDRQGNAVLISRGKTRGYVHLWIQRCRCCCLHSP
jgi:hypothetical protein